MTSQIDSAMDQWSRLVVTLENDLSNAWMTMAQEATQEVASVEQQWDRLLGIAPSASNQSLGTIGQQADGNATTVHETALMQGTNKVGLPPIGIGPPPLNVWIGGGSNAWSDPTQWLSGQVPQYGDDVFFDGNYSQNNCIFDGANLTPGTPIANSITMQNGYGGTVHFQQSSSWGSVIIGPGGLTLPSGDIEQDTGQEIDDYGDFNWSGGSVNVNSPFLADFKEVNANTVSITGTNRSGTNLVLKNGSRAVMSDPGAGAGIIFSKGAGINIDANSAFNWVDGSISVAAGAPVGAIKNQGLLQKTTGILAGVLDDLPISNSGTFQLQQGFFNINKKDGNGNGFDNSGTCDLTGGTSLKCTGNFHQSAGNFWTEGTQVVSVIADNGVFDGGLINLNHGTIGGNTGGVDFSKAVKIQGTTEWDCKADCSVQNPMAVDYITASNGITLGGPTSIFKAIAVNLTASGGTVPANQTWAFLTDLAGNKINGNFNKTTLAFNDGSGKAWTIGVSQNGDIWSLNS